MWYLAAKAKYCNDRVCVSVCPLAYLKRPHVHAVLVCKWSTSLSNIARFIIRNKAIVDSKLRPRLFPAPSRCRPPTNDSASYIVITNAPGAPFAAIIYKSSAVAEMGDRARAKWAEKWRRELLCPFPWGELGHHLTQWRLCRGLPPYQVES